MMQAVSIIHYRNKKPRADAVSLSSREREFLNDILKVKSDNRDWGGHYRVYPEIINEMKKELSEINPNWHYNYQRKMKLRVLRKYDRIIADADLLRSAIDKVRAL
jgi:hypothetical protein